MAFVESWVETDPDGSVITVSQLDDYDRQAKRAIRERLEGDPANANSGIFESGTFAATAIVRSGTARTYTDTIANIGLYTLQNGRLFIATDTGRMYHLKGTGAVELQYMPVTGGTFTGSIGTLGNLAVTGTSALGGDVTIGVSKFTVIAATGNAFTAGTMDVTGDFKVATNKFTVTAASGNTLVAGTFRTNGAVTFDTNISQTAGTAALQAVTATTGVFSSTLASTAHTITSASATSLAVGPAGVTNPVFTVDSSTGAQAAGLKLTGAATGGTVALVATDSGLNTSVSLSGKGTGNLILQSGLTTGVGIYSAPQANVDLAITRATGSAVVVPITIQLHSTNDAADWATVNWANLDFYTDDVTGGAGVHARIGARHSSAGGSFSHIAFSAGNTGGLNDILLLDGQSQRVMMPSLARLHFDGVNPAAAGDTYMVESAANVLDIFAGNINSLRLTATTAKFIGGTLDLSNSAYDLTLKSVTTNSLTVKDDAAVTWLTIDTRTTAIGGSISSVDFRTPSVTILNNGTRNYSAIEIEAAVIGNSAAANGTGTGIQSNSLLRIGSYTQDGVNGSYTQTEVNTVYINGAPIATGTAGTTTLTRSMALYIGTSAVNGVGGAVTDAWGFRVDAPSGATTGNYAAFLNGDAVLTAAKKFYLDGSATGQGSNTYITESAGDIIQFITQGVTGLIVDGSVGSMAAGITITGATSAGTVALVVNSSGGNTSYRENAKGSGTFTIQDIATGQVSIGRGVRNTPILAGSITSLGTTQNTTPTIAQLLTGVVTQTSATGAGTVTTPTGTNMSGGITNVATGDFFDTVFSNLGGGFNLTITAGASGMTVRGNAVVPSGKNALLRFICTGANTWECYVIPSA